MWQELRSELHPKGLEVVTVALDTAGWGAARPFVERAKPEHPSLIDQAHRLDQALGVVNVPSGVWIDEDGMIVRPPEPAFASRPGSRTGGRRAGELPPRVAQMLEEAAKIRVEPEKYVAAVRDWVEHGADSPYALSPEEVVTRSRPRPGEGSEAAAHFELGQHLYREGLASDAVGHFREAHRLDPDNWTYRRQAWSLASPVQGPLEGQESDWPYEGDWLSDVRKIGAESYYPALDL